MELAPIHRLAATGRRLMEMFEEAKRQVSLAAAPIFGTPRHAFETTSSEAQRELVWAGTWPPGRPVPGLTRF